MFLLQGSTNVSEAFLYFTMVPFCLRLVVRQISPVPEIAQNTSAIPISGQRPDFIVDSDTGSIRPDGMIINLARKKKLNLKAIAPNRGHQRSTLGIKTHPTWWENATTCAVPSRTLCSANYGLVCVFDRNHSSDAGSI